MDQMILDRIAEGLYATEPANAMAGLAFVPEVDTTASSLSLSGEVTEQGRWFIWSNGSLMPVLGDVVSLVRANRARIQFSRGPYDTGPLSIELQLGTIPSNDFVVVLDLKFAVFSGVSVSSVPRIELVQSRLEISTNGLHIVPGGGSSHLFRGPGAGAELSDLRILASGDRAGAFAFSTVLPFQYLPDFGVHSSITTADGPGLGGLIGIADEIRPVLSEDRQPIGLGLPLEAVLDPIDLAHSERSMMIPPEGAQLLSRLKGVHGHDVLLGVPNRGDVDRPPCFRFVMNRTAETEQGDPHNMRASMLPDGEFDLAFAMPGNAKSVAVSNTGLAVGDTPHEFISLGDIEERTTTRIELRHDHAHITDKDGDLSDGTLVGTGRPFEDVTLWAKVHTKGKSGDAMPFVSEARAIRILSDGRKVDDEIQLRHPAPRLLARKDGFVPLLPAPVTVPSHDKVPVSARLSSVRRAEVEAGTIKSSLTGVALSAEKSPKRTTRVTASGFEVVEDVLGNVVEVVFARGDWNSKVSGKIGIEGTETDGFPGAIKFDLVAALLRNNLFAAMDQDRNPASNPEAEFNFAAQISVSGWGFSAKLVNGANAPSTPVPDDALVLVKGYEGLSILQLIQAGNHKLWSGRKYASSITDIATRVSALHTKITTAPLDKDPRYSALRIALADANWNGVLVLDVNLDPATLPNQIKGLMGGVDKNKFKADHIGFPVQRLSDTTSKPKARPFAAIDYEGLDLASTADGGYEFSVRRLAAGFANGKIQSFKCDLQLGVGTLFEDGNITLKKGGSTEHNRVITLEGSYERRRENGQDMEVYTFLTNDDFKIQMSQKFPLIDVVHIDKLGYSSTVTKGPNEEDKVAGKFLFDGDVDFKELDLGLGGGNFDFFDISKVGFGDLSIDMDFDILPDSISSPKLKFNPGSLIFDFRLGKKKLGGGGFFSSFPIKWTGFGWLSGQVNLPSLGFFSLRDEGVSGAAPFFLKFELDLGSFGSLGSALKDFKLELGIVFGFNGGRPVIDIGIKFPSSTSGSLDIGIQGVLELKAKKYELVQLKYEKDGVEGKAWGFRGVEVELIVFGKSLPPGDVKSGVYIFANPSNIDDGVGWLLSTVVKSDEDGVNDGSINLKQLVLGQRVDPLPDLPISDNRVTTEDVLEQFAANAIGSMPKRKDSDKPGQEVQIPGVKYAPDRGWTIGFDLQLFDYLSVGLAIRDPDLAGLRIEIADLFDLDILYRKLSEDLGVYSAEIALAENLRHWQFGAAGITIPVIAVDVYTDGAWGVDIGYPHDKDFSRSFHLNILPFTGAGGFTFQRVAGPAAKLLPAEGLLSNGDWAPYDPITEVQMGARVGLGVAVGSGAFRAGLSLTVYTYLIGGYGRLRLKSGQMPQAKRSYILVEGIVGIMGELYGYVDFSIVRAGVNITLWVESGIRFETDRALRLHYEVGVRVRVSVVIGKVCVFGKCLKISISFSFSSKVRIQQKIGSDGPEGIYRGRKAALLDVTPNSYREVLKSGLDWSVYPLPSSWGSGADKLPLLCVLQPDITVVFDPETGTPEVHVIMLLATRLTRPENKAAPAQEASGAEELVRGMAAWAINVLLANSTQISAEDLRQAVDQLADARTARAQPTAQQISAFLGEAFEATTVDLDAATTSPESTKPAQAALLPLPGEVRVKHKSTAFFTPNDFDFVTKQYVDEADKKLEAQMLVETDDSPEFRSETSVASVMTREWAALSMRTALVKMAEYIDTLGEGEMRTANELLDWLIKPHDHKTADAVKLRSSAAEVAMVAGQTLIAGPRIPMPEVGGNVPDWVEAAPAGSEDDWFQPMYRLGGLQFPLDVDQPPLVEAGQYGWLTVPRDVDLEDVDAAELTALVVVAKDMQNAAIQDTAPLFNTILSHAPLFTMRPRYVRLGTKDTADRIGGRIAWKIDALSAEPKKRAFVKAQTSANAPLDFKQLEANEKANLTPAILVDVAVSLTGDTIATSTDARDPLTIRAMEEVGRTLLDTALTSGLGPSIENVRLYLVNPDGTAGDEVGANNDERPIIFKTNPSFEVRPQSFLKSAARQDLAVVDASDGENFLELVRQAVIVNTSGFTLLVPKMNWGAAIDPMNGGTRLRIVAELGAGKLSQADDPRLDYANVLVSDESLWDDGTVLACEVDKELNPLHEPGVLAVDVRRDLVNGAAFSKEQQVLSERYSAACFELEFNGKAILKRDQSVAVTPNYETPGTDDGNDLAPLEYRSSMAFGQLVGATVSPREDMREEASGASPTADLYRHVGEPIDVGVHWRDIYGNLWGNEAAKVQQMALRYSDRLVGLVGLPFIRVVHEPKKVGGNFGVKVALHFDAAALTEAVGPEMDSGHLHQARRALQRAAAQVRDGRVVIALKIGEEGPRHALSETDKDQVVGFIDAVAIAVAQAWSGNASNPVPAVSFDYAVSLPGDTRPSEFSVKLLVTRPTAVSNLHLYPLDEVMRLTGVTTHAEAIDAIAEVIETSHVVPSPVEVSLGKQVMVFAQYLDLLEVALSGTHRVATGRSARARGSAGAVWMIPKAMLEKLEEAELKKRAGVPFAFRPLQNRPMSADFGGDLDGISQPATAQDASPPARPVRVIDADVDQEARQVIDFVERATAPELVAHGVLEEGALGPINAFLDRLNDLRRGLAMRLVENQLGPVFASQSGVNLTENAAKRIGDRLSRDLTRYDTTGGFLIYPDETSTEARKIGLAYGEVIGADPAAKPDPFAIEIAPETGEVTRSDLIVGFGQQIDDPMDLNKFVLTPPKAFRVTHVQRLDRPSAGETDAGYLPTAWLRLHDRALRADDTANAWTIAKLSQAQGPIMPLRRAPSTPTLVSEEFRTNEQPGDLAQLRDWQSHHTIDIGPFATQDILKTSVAFPQGGAASAFLAKSGLRTSDEPLALRILRMSQELKPDKPKGGDWKGVQPEDLYLGANRQNMRDWFIDRLENLIAEPKSFVRSTAGPSDPTDRFEIRESAASANKLLVEIKRLDMAAKTARWVLGDGTKNGQPSLDAPSQVNVETDGTLSDPGSKLRTMILSGLDVLRHGSSRSAHSVVRNRDVKGKLLDPLFVYQTPVVTSAEPIVPVLDHPEPLLLGDIALDSTGAINSTLLNGQLEGILGGLLGDAERPIATDILVEYETDTFLSSDRAAPWREGGGPLIVVVSNFGDATEIGIAKLAGVLTEEIIAWSEASPIRDGQNRPMGRILFDVRVYDGSKDADEQMDDTRILWLREGVLKFPTET